MKKKIISDAITNISSEYIEKAADYKVAKKSRKPIWMKWGAMAACLCLLMVAIPIVNHFVQTSGDGNNSLPQINVGGSLQGDTEIYPTVMVNDTLYEWRKGAAIVFDGLPQDCIYYGEITHIDGTVPNENGQFVSVFDVEGQIYTLPNNTSVVYLKVTTDWLTETVVAFDLVTR